jgi:hypothetical protein
MANNEPLTQINVSLPPTLLDFLKSEAAHQDRTIGGMVRHYVAEAYRAAGSPTRRHAVPPLPQVKPTPESIAEGRARLAHLEEKCAQIDRRRKSRTENTSAVEDTTQDKMMLEIDYLRKGITMAERMMEA